MTDTFHELLETIPCETCGRPTPYTGTKRCNNCWEVERRLEGYMVTPQSLAFVRRFMPVLDDWVDGHPDAWDYEKVLADNNVTVEWCDKLTSDGVTFEQAPPDLCGWGFYWVNGAIHIGQTAETIARKAAALASMQQAGGIPRREGYAVEDWTEHGTSRPLSQDGRGRSDRTSAESSRSRDRPG